MSGRWGAAWLGRSLALIGGFIFRMVVVRAGKDSANDPKYYFEYTRRANGAGGSR